MTTEIISEMNYLDADFNPKDSKMAELRKILTENRVEYPNKAKKSVLVKLFNDDVKPRVPELREKQKNVKPTSEGIELVKSKQRSKSKSPKKKKRTREEAKKEEESKEEEKETISIDIVDKDGDIKMELSPRKSPSKKKGKHESPKKSENVEEEGSKKKRRRKDQKKRKSLGNSSIDMTASPEKSLQIDKFETESNSSASPNTSFNDIKSHAIKGELKFASSEPLPAPLRRRAPDLAKLNVSEEFRAKLKEAVLSQEPEIIPVEIKKEDPVPIEVSVQDAITKEESDEITSSDVIMSSDEVKTSEQASPEVGTENIVNNEDKINSSKEIQPETKQPCKLKAGKCAKGALKFVGKSLYFSVIASAVLYGVWMREQRFQVGFCGEELPLKSITGTFKDNKLLQDVDNFLQDSLKPQCQPCPENAVCSTNLHMTCTTGFNLVESPFSLNGLLPFVGECVKDDSERRAINKMVDHAMKYLREQNSRVECGRGSNKEISGISLEELFDNVSEDIMEEFELSKHQIKTLWSGVVKKVKTFPEVHHFVVSEDSQNEDSEEDTTGKTIEFLHSSSRKAISMGCLYENELKTFYLENLYYIWGTLATLLLSFFTKRAIEKGNKQQEEIDEYTKKATEALKKQAKEDSDFPFLHTLQLKEAILADIVDLNRKNLLWDQLIDNLEKDTENISSNQADIQGEIVKCWKWIGDDYQ